MQAFLIIGNLLSVGIPSEAKTGGQMILTRRAKGEKKTFSTIEGPG